MKPRVSLRFALLLLTAIAVLVGSWANRARQQAAAVASLRAAGALVIYDQQKLDATNGQLVSKFQSPFLPKALIDWLGPDYLVNVDMVWPCATRDLPLAAKLHSLQYLALVDDDQHPDFTALSRCRSLTYLTIQSPGLDDAALATIGRLPAIERVELFGDGKITPHGLSGLAQSRSLRSADIRGCADSVTALDAEPFRQANKLKQLWIISGLGHGAKEVVRW